MNKKLFETKLISKKSIATNTLELVFEKPTGFDFIAGQFVRFQIPDKENLVERSYSLASDPKEDRLIFYIKLIKDGKASTYFEKIKKGDKVKFTEAIGKFVFNENKQNHYFIATGVGLAPMIGIIKDRLENKNTQNKINLLFGVRNVELIFCKEMLEKWDDMHENFNFKLTLSQPSEKWQGSKGRVTEHLPENTKNTQFYMCGNLEMIKDVRNSLLDKGVNSKDIIFEIF